MNTIVQADGIELTNALQQYAKDKLKKLDRYNVINLKCLIKIDGLDNVVEIIADDQFISVKAADMYHAIVKAVDVMQLSLEKTKAKYRTAECA